VQVLSCNFGLVQELEPSAPLPLQQAAAPPLLAALSHRILALEQFWTESAVGGAAGPPSLLARAEALELIVFGAAQPRTSFLARVEALELIITGKV
jgi:hypothetical protein